MCPVLTLWDGAGLACTVRVAMIGKGQESGERYLVMVSSSVQLHLLLKACRGSSDGRWWRRAGSCSGSEGARLVAEIVSGHHHDLVPLLVGGGRRGPDAAGWGHHLRHCVPS
jgi:hypothetical protein